MSAARKVLNVESTPSAAAWFTAITVAMTWPLATGLGRLIPHDLVDPLLNCWALAWGADHLLRALGGGSAALSGFWNANIFYPDVLSLAFSEHLFAQVLQILPIYAVTGNLVLCYNLLFLSTFILSALGMYLLVRELTGNGTAAFVAGLVYGFVPYRALQYGHLQVLSSQWMPFALFFLRRYFDRGRVGWLAAASAALVLQNLSCGYFLVFFLPFAAAYALYEMSDRGLLGDSRRWLELAGAGVAVALVTLPFVLPYLELRSLGVPPRPPDEVDRYSANVFSYLTADPDLLVWGSILQAIPKAEGGLFLGFVPVGLAAAGLAGGWRRARVLAAVAPGLSGTRRWLAAATGAIAAAAGLLTVTVLFAGRFVPLLRMVSPYAANVSYVGPVALTAGLAHVALSPRARLMARGIPASPQLFCLAALIVAAYLSFGRIIESMYFRVSDETLYGVLYRVVPGFNGLRVPGRYAMVVSLFLAVLAGFGAAGLARASRRGRILVAAAAILFLAEAMPSSLELKRLAWPIRSAAITGETARPFDASRIYRRLTALPADAVLTELPFGQVQDEARYLFFSTLHWRRLTNGYSGYFPRSYLKRREALNHPLADLDAAWAELKRSGTTHVVVHEWAFEGTTGREISSGLEQRGARVVALDGSDVVLAIR